MGRFVSGLMAGRRLARLWLEADATRWARFGSGERMGGVPAGWNADVDAACARLDACTGDAI